MLTDNLDFNSFDFFKTSLDELFQDNIKHKSVKKNCSIKICYPFSSFSIENCKIKYPISTNYKNLKNFMFYPIGYEHHPPKRIIIKDLDDY